MGPASGDPAITGARFGHVNLIARDWRRLAAFYTEVFGCVPVPPERDYVGADLDRGTGLAGARLRGVHLRLPGAGEHGAGPTLEVYTYDQADGTPREPTGSSGLSGSTGAPPAVDRPGFAHLAFVVDDVAAARTAVLAAGGGAVGEVVTLATSAGGRVTWCYVTDPEGNVLELQRWA